MEAKDATSHGATSIEAKLIFSLLLTKGALPVDFVIVEAACNASPPFAGLIRDMVDVEVNFAGVSESDESSDIFLLLRDPI